MVTGEHVAHERRVSFPLAMTIGGAVLAGVFGIIVAAVTGEPSFLLLAILGAATGWTIASFASIEVDRADEPDESSAH
ncbi:MAG TPA: hypothetical protein VFW96_17515 [Thermomicrobiales bacterium]|nr:hypothetical protein [Thermomicrobiales bacterium]